MGDSAGLGRDEDGREQRARRLGAWLALLVFALVALPLLLKLAL